LKAVAKKKKPFLSKKHRKARMDFALTHQHLDCGGLEEGGVV
jgi:hypothetical protein